VKDFEVDAPPVADDACVAETDGELCAAADSCEAHAFTDRCGAQRAIDCGACDGAKACVVGSCKTPVCSTFTYTRAVLSTFSVTGVEDSLASATPDGGVIVYIPTGGSNVCRAFQIVIADEVTPGSGNYDKQNITEFLTFSQMAIAQNAYTITADGLTLIGRNAASTEFQALTRSARGKVDFSAPDPAPFKEIADQCVALGGNARVTAPVISADGLQFLYTITDADDAAQSGIYSAERASTSVAFAAGTKLGPPVSDHLYASALSSDRLAIFVFDNFSSRVYTRMSTTGAWVNPSAPAPAPTIPGWEHKPLADCSTLISMGGEVGGCQNEDIYLYTRQ
jgi:hypothetical protein